MRGGQNFWSRVCPALDDSICGIRDRKKSVDELTDVASSSSLSTGGPSPALSWDGDVPPHVRDGGLSPSLGPKLARLALEQNAAGGSTRAPPAAWPSEFGGFDESEVLRVVPRVVGRSSAAPPPPAPSAAAAAAAAAAAVPLAAIAEERGGHGGGAAGGFPPPPPARRPGSRLGLQLDQAAVLHELGSGSASAAGPSSDAPTPPRLAAVPPALLLGAGGAGGAGGSFQQGCRSATCTSSEERAMVGELFGAHAVDAIWDAPRAAPRAAGSNGSPHTDAGGGPGVKRRRDVAGEPPPP